MRHFFMLTLVAVAIGLLPATVRADNPNQEAAQRISDHLSKNGQLGDKITVRYLNGTVWLQGHVHDQDHFNRAMNLVFSTKGVTVNQVVRDELTIDSARPASASAPAVANPLRGTELAVTDGSRAQPTSQANLQLVQTQATAPIPAVPAAPIPAPEGCRRRK